MHHRMLRLVAALAFAVLPLAASMSPAGADNVSTLLGLVNTLRIGRGAAPLVADPGLTLAAQQWSAHMAATGTLAHNPNLASQVPTGWGKLGENVGDGGSLTGIFNLLVADPPHLANMVDPMYNITGIAVATGRNGTLWVTQDFEAVAGSRPAPPPAPATTLAPPRTSPPTRATVPRTAIAPTTAPRPTPVTPTAAPPEPTPPTTVADAPTTSARPTTTPPSTQPTRSRADSKAVSALAASTGGGRPHALLAGSLDALAALGLLAVVGGWALTLTRSRASSGS